MRKAQRNQQEKILKKTSCFTRAIAPPSQLLVAEQQFELAANAQPDDASKTSELQALDDNSKAKIMDQAKPVSALTPPPVSPRTPEPVLPATSSSKCLQSNRATLRRYNLRASPRR